MSPTQNVVHHEPIALRAFVEGVLVGFETNARARHVELDALVFSAALKADASLLRRLLTGLVGDALRRAPAGTNVSLVVSPRGRYTEFRVADEGPGIAVGMREKGVDAGAEGLRGDASGLTLCMLAAEANGGRLSVAETDAGTVVCLALPSEVGPTSSNQPQVVGAAASGVAAAKPGLVHSESGIYARAGELAAKLASGIDT